MMVGVKRAVLVLGCLLLPACAGPDRPLEVGFKEVPSDVVLGASATPGPSASAPAPVVVAPPPPSVITLPPPPFSTTPPPQAPPAAPPSPAPTGCPSLDPLEAPAVEAPSAAQAPPVPASYLYTQVGTFAVSGANARQGTFPPTLVRVVGDVVDDDRGFAWSVAETVGDTTTTTRYRVVDDQRVPGQAGLYVERMDYRRTDGATAAFTPTPALQLAAFPLVRGATLETRGVDPTTQTTMTFTSTVTGKARVPVCGEPLDSWTLDLTAGRLVTPTSDLDFEATYALGTQYGGLLLRDAVAFSGTDGSAGVTRSSTATVTVEPARV
jgi:hypothetical protein